MLQIDEQRLYATIGEKIKQARVLRGLSQGDLAANAGLERTSITNIEGGKQRAPLHILFRLCATLHIEPSEIFPRLEDLVGRPTIEVEHKGGVALVPPLAASIIQSLRSSHEAS